MPEPCISTEAKALLQDVFPDDERLIAFLERGVPTCAVGPEPRTQKQKRAPSAYNLHMKECIPRERRGDEPVSEVMKRCAVEWRRVKERPDAPR